MKRGSCLSQLVIGFVFVLVLGLSAYSINGNSGATHALSLEKMPFGTKVNQYALSSWTDYMFECEISLKPGHVDKLLSGRKFEKILDDYQIGRRPEVNRMVFPIDFEVDESWCWSHSEEYGAPTCRVYFNQQKTRAVVEYLSD